MHPLVSNLTDLSDAELHKKHGDLINRVNQAYRIGPSSIIGQLEMILADYQIEIQRRNQLAYEEMLRKGKTKDGIIDIK